MEENQCNFKVSFEKDNHSINVETYSKCLTALTTLLKEVNYQSGNNFGEIDVNISAEEPGSFTVVFELIRLLAKKENVELFLNGAETLIMLVEMVVGIIELKIALNGKEIKPKIEGEKVVYIDGSNNTVFETTTNVYNIYNTNQAVNDAISAAYKAVDNDKEIKAVTYKYSDKESRIDREQFDILSKKRVIQVADEKVSNVVADLVVSKVVLDNPNKKWQFIYQGARISATIIDKDFWDRVLPGEESFANGDKLVCDLEIVRDFDERLGTFLNKDYIVRNVRDHRPREVAEQLEII